MTLEEFKSYIDKELHDENLELSLKVQNGTLPRQEYLDSIRLKGREQELPEEEIEEVVTFADKTLWGFGLIDDYMNGTIPDVTDIRLINKDKIEVKIKGKRSLIPLKFSTTEEYKKYIAFITSRNSTVISASNAGQVFADTTTSEKYIYRYTLVSDLLNTNKIPSLHIRLTLKEKKTMDDLINEGFITREQADKLIFLWQNGASMIIAGPNGSGKTTLQNALLDYTPVDKSMSINCEVPDLFVDLEEHPLTLTRQILPSRTDTAVSYSLADLCRLNLTESIDIMVISEIKGNEAKDFGYAAYTGSQVLTSVHSISSADAFERICDLGVQGSGLERSFFERQLKNIKVSVFVKDYKVCEIEEK